jgi:hypothetical protein
LFIHGEGNALCSFGRAGGSGKLLLSVQWRVGTRGAGERWGIPRQVPARSRGGRQRRDGAGPRVERVHRPVRRRRRAVARCGMRQFPAGRPNHPQRPPGTPRPQRHRRRGDAVRGGTGAPRAQPARERPPQHVAGQHRRLRRARQALRPRQSALRRPSGLTLPAEEPPRSGCLQERVRWRATRWPQRAQQACSVHGGRQPFQWRHPGFRPRKIHCVQRLRQQPHRPDPQEDWALRR